MPETMSRQSRQQADTPGRDASDKFTGLIMLTAAVSAISSLLYGYDTGIISSALLQIRKDFHTGSTTEQIIAGSILFGAALGALAMTTPGDISIARLDEVRALVRRPNARIVR